MLTPFEPDKEDFYLGDPDAHFSGLRAADGLHWYADGPFWCVTRHADVADISRRPRQFSSAHGTQLFEVAAQLSGQMQAADESAPSIIRMDPPAHNLHRKLVMKSFTPARIAGLESRIRAITRESLDAVGSGEVIDFVDSIAVPLPMFVIAELLGVPVADYADFKRWSDALIDAGGGNFSPDMAVVLGQAFNYFATRAATARRTPKDDLLSKLATAEVEGESLTDAEIVIFCVTLLVAGNETTRNLISGGMKALLEHPDQLAQLRADPARIENAVEEMLRYVTPVRSFVRRVQTQMEFAGAQLEAGQYVALFYGAANRDEAVFGPDADRFDITRESARRHIAFGFGEHLCLGASLARLEARVMFEELLKTFDRIEAAGDPVPLRSILINGLVHLPVRCQRR